jgi:hypothetical protein
MGRGLGFGEGLEVPARMSLRTAMRGEKLVDEKEGSLEVSMPR